MGRELSLSLDWDPRDVDGPMRTPPPGDFRGVLASLDDDVSERTSPEILLGAKAITLNQLKQPGEAVGLVRQIAERSGADRLPLILAQGRLCVGLVLDERGEHVAADQAFSDIASFYGRNEDPAIRAVAVVSLAARIRAIIDAGDLDRIRPAWESLRSFYGADLDHRVRLEVARAGGLAAVGLARAGRRADALAACEEAIALYQHDTDPAIRADVAAIMWARLEMLPRTTRLRTRARAARELLHFIGSDPEPEVIEAMREVNPKYAEKILRRAHDAH